MHRTVLLLGITSFVIGCGGSNNQEEEVPRGNAPPRDPAIVKLERYGAGAKVDKSDPDNPFILVDLTRRDVKDETLSHLADLKEPLEVIARGSGRITDRGFAHLKGLKTIRKLDLSGTRISDEGLASLDGLENLEVLDLSDTKITDDGLAHLKSLPKVRELKLQNTPITNQGVAGLRHLKTIRLLNLGGTRIDDDGISLFRAFPELRELDVSFTDISQLGQDRVFDAYPQVKVLR